MHTNLLLVSMFAGLQIRCVFLFSHIYFLPNPLFVHLLESSHRDDSNKWSNIGFGEEMTQVESMKVHFTHLIWSSGFTIHNSPAENGMTKF